MERIGELIEEAKAAGLEVRAEGERLIVRGPRSAGALAEALLARKAEVMRLLAEASQGSGPGQASQPEQRALVSAVGMVTEIERGLRLDHRFRLSAAYKRASWRWRISFEGGQELRGDGAADCASISGAELKQAIVEGVRAMLAGEGLALAEGASWAFALKVAHAFEEEQPFEIALTGVLR